MNFLAVYEKDLFRSFHPLKRFKAEKCGPTMPAFMLVQVLEKIATNYLNSFIAFYYKSVLPDF